MRSVLEFVKSATTVEMSKRYDVDRKGRAKAVFVPGRHSRADVSDYQAMKRTEGARDVTPKKKDKPKKYVLPSAPPHSPDSSKYSRKSGSILEFTKAAAKKDDGKKKEELKKKLKSVAKKAVPLVIMAAAHGKAPAAAQRAWKRSGGQEESTGSRIVRTARAGGAATVRGGANLVGEYGEGMSSHDMGARARKAGARSTK